MTLERRITIAQAWIDALLYPLDETIGALGADGWSVAQARAGFALHMQTWDITRLAQSLQSELASVGGLAALDRPVLTPQGARRLHAPQKILHVWPALPGAGVTPVLAGWLLGSTQVIRASSRGTYFATHALQVWRSVAGDAGAMLEFEAPGEGWQQADVVVISGSDETVSAVRAFLGGPGHRGRPTVVGFGHRVSAAVVLDDEDAPYARWAAELAVDIVQWHQQGCFSARGVIFRGSRDRARVFAATLAAALGEAERRMGSPRDAAQLARRAQARGVAEFTGEVFGEPSVGWVQLAHTPWAGEAIAAHCVTLHVIDGLAQLSGAIALRPHNLQGVALATTRQGPRRDAWVDALSRAGFTRICAPGKLQAPPPEWLHDGAPNVLDWVRVTSVDL